MPTCEICGRECSSTREISLEGAQLQACSRCAELGEPVRRPKPAMGRSSTIPRSRPVSIPRPTATGRPSPRYRQPSRELVAVENFQMLIRKAREQRGMSQKDVAGKLHERTSIIAKLESGKLTPTISLARKLEHLFKLTLLEEAESVDLSPAPSTGTTTLGDVVQIKRKKPS
ncbi:MAG: multiprotein bridging factor aMBF1 [Candidatus Hermodarchaeota archaeon]|jgi:putative transcription factor|nr:multiprotein bridging factor aMBF1 [Candidatus Hermodarchaeota archaeon]